MFDSPAQAAEALLDYFERPRVEMVVQALVPAMLLQPTGAGIVIGGTRLGGAPDLPHGFAWPRPEMPVNAEEIASRGNSDAAAGMRAHLEAQLPFAFVGQIDLAEAGAPGPLAAKLPAEGRLLFFYDFSIGPWESGSRVARVIWETSPRERLHALPMPDDLAAAAAAEAREWATLASVDRREDAGTNFGAPAQAMRLRATWRLPDTHALEFEALPDLAAAGKSLENDPAMEALYSTYEEALEAFDDRDVDEKWKRQQLLGSPMPEQSDPRQQAVIVTRWGKEFLSRPEWLENAGMIATEARNWRLLLQLDVADWMQAPFVEGTVYFLIRDNDLEQREFDSVVAVYQQT